MSPIVLDTDVVSFLFKNDSRAERYLPHLNDRQWVISFMTEAELEQWVLLAEWQPKRVEWLRRFLKQFIIAVFARFGCAMGRDHGGCSEEGSAAGDGGCVDRGDGEFI